MKRVCFLLLLLLPVFAFSQVLLDRFKQKVKDRVEQRADEGMDKALDEAENSLKKKKGKEEGGEEQQDEPKAETAKKTQTAAPSFKSYSRYDFIPGDEMVYAEDFSQDVIGEFPLKWATNNRGETVTIDQMQGKWLKMFKEGHFVSPYLKSLPENFTIEFDVVFHLEPNTYNTNYPDLSFRLFHSEPGDEQARKFFNEYFESNADFKVTFVPDFEGRSMIQYRSSEGGNSYEYFISPLKYVPKLHNYFDKPAHIAIWVQKGRFRLWINGEKIYDLPNAVPGLHKFNRFELETATSGYDDDHFGYHISNFRFAQGAPDMRSKLITEGKLVTNGILFDVNSDKIKPESAGVLQEIAKVLKENPAVKVNIIGHTDNDGEEAKNLELSRRRSAAVKQALSTEFGIDASRMVTDGKGEAQPISDNNSKEGKAKNRRVEFIKL